MKLTPFESMREAEDFVVPAMLVGTAAGIAIGAAAMAVELAMAKPEPVTQTVSCSRSTARARRRALRSACFWASVPAT